MSVPRVPPLDTKRSLFRRQETCWVAGLIVHVAKGVQAGDTSSWSCPCNRRSLDMCSVSKAPAVVSTHQTLGDCSQKHCRRLMSILRIASSGFAYHCTERFSRFLMDGRGERFWTSHLVKLCDCWSSTCWKNSGIPNFSDKVGFTHFLSMSYNTMEAAMVAW